MSLLERTANLQDSNALRSGNQLCSEMMCRTSARSALTITMSRRCALQHVNHRFCRACWKGYIGAKVAEGPAVLGLRCPLPNCRAAVCYLPNAPLLILWRRLPDRLISVRPWERPETSRNICCEHGSEVCSVQLVLPEAMCQGRKGLRSGAADAAGASEHNLRSSERHRPQRSTAVLRSGAL